MITDLGNEPGMQVIYFFTLLRMVATEKLLHFLLIKVLILIVKTKGTGLRCIMQLGLVT
jgi:hypothetical protein